MCPGTPAFIDCEFDKQEYFSPANFRFKYSSLPLTKNYRNAIITMFNDLIPETTYLELEKEKEKLLKIEKVKKENI